MCDFLVTFMSTHLNGEGGGDTLLGDCQIGIGKGRVSVICTCYNITEPSGNGKTVIFFISVVTSVALAAKADKYIKYRSLPDTGTTLCISLAFPLHSLMLFCLFYGLVLSTQ